MSTHSETRVPVASRSSQSKASHSENQKRLSKVGLAYGRLIHRFRWIVVGLWFVLVLAALPLAHGVPLVLHNSGYTVPSESSHVSTILTSTLHQPMTQVLVVFQSAHTPVTDQAYQDELRSFLTRVKTFPHIISTTQGGVGQDTRTTYVLLGFDQNQDSVASSIPTLRQVLRASAIGPAQTRITGEPAVGSEIQLDTASNTDYAEIIALPATLLVLLFVFGTIVAAALPLLLAGVAVLTALASIYLIALHIETNIFVQSITSILGLGLAIDYSLIFLRRFREELANGETVPEAVAATIATAGEAILLSAMTVIIGFAGLLFMGIQVMTSFSIAGMIIAGTAVLSAMTLLPALLSILGSRVNTLSVYPRVLRGRGEHLAQRDGQRSFWQRWAGLVQRRPVAIIALVLVILVLLGWPALALNPGLPGESALPTNSEARQGLDILRAQFPALNTNPIEIIVQTTDGSSVLATRNLSQLNMLTHWIGDQAHVRGVEDLAYPPASQGTSAPSWAQLQQLYSTGAYQRIPSLNTFVAATTAGDTTLVTVNTDTTAGSSADQALIDHLRAIDPRITHGFSLLVGGPRVVDLDFDRTLYSSFLRAFVFILIATYALLFVTFRSALLPLKAILMNVFSVAAAYGVLVFVFQLGHGQEMLGFTADGSIDRFVPLLLFCILFGLSMDYEVFLLMRVYEEWRRTGNNTRSIAFGLEKTGGVITSAALLFVIVSASFILTSLIVTKELGLGITTSIIVDATIIRSLLVPATMQLFGRWNWWPSTAARKISDTQTERGLAQERNSKVSP